MKQQFVSRIKAAVARKLHRSLCMLVALAVLLGGMQTHWLVPIAQAATVDELQAEASALKAQIEADQAELEALQEFAEDEEAEKANIESQLETLEAQIDVLLALIEQVQTSINEKQAEIETITGEIEEKQGEYDTALEEYRQRLAAMQELNDGGAIAFLSSVENLYQLLSFSEVFQSITDRDTELLESLERQRLSLESSKDALEIAQAELQADFDALDVQRDDLNAAQATYNANLLLVSASIAEAEAAQDALEDKISEQTVQYSEIASEIAALISGSTEDYGDLNFTDGFMVPLASGSYYISRGYTTDHPAIDYAAGEWTPIYASASGYVTASGWNSGGYGNYVLIYHGAMGDNTYSTLYAHMVQTPSVSVGDFVLQGTLIGYVGNTGYSFGNHLHFELWAGSTISNSVANKATRVDPALYL